MIKTLLSTFAICLSFSTLSAQFNCSGGRFIEEVFPNFTLTSDITYGSAANVTGANQSLQLDIYEPEGDTAGLRPLLILAHGGSFVFGNKTGPDVVPLCVKYAKLGYVVASIEYRLGYENFFPTPATATQTVYRASSDMKAAIRYFRSQVAGGTNNFRIHPDYIFSGGVSAGAFTALHAAYLDQESEIPADVNPANYGGIEGNSGNPGYPSNVRGIVNLCGAIGDTSWIVAGDPPCVSAHGTADGTVPYGSDVINVLGQDLLLVDGSASIVQRLGNLGIDNPFASWPGIGHTPFVDDALYLDSVYQIVTPFLANLVGCDVPASMKAPQPEFVIYPNPADESGFSVRAAEPWKRCRIIDFSGREVFQAENNSASATLHINLTLDSGIYLLQIDFGSGKSATRKFIRR